MDNMMPAVHTTYGSSNSCEVVKYRVHSTSIVAVARFVTFRRDELQETQQNITGKRSNEKSGEFVLSRNLLET